MTIEKVKITSIEEWQDWVTSPPPEEQIETIDGVFIIRHKIIEKKLDMITNFNWETRNYQSKIIELVDANNVKHQYISASLELVVNTTFLRSMTRVLVGAVSIPMAFFQNEDGTLHGHFDNTAKSLCISNAASELGEQFGRNLNDVPPVITAKKKSNGNRRQPVKMIPDAKIKKQYAEAVAFNELDTVAKLLALYEFPDPVKSDYAE
jgi:hypothetical protein